MKRLILLSTLLCCPILASAYYPIIKNYSKSEYKAGSKNWSISQSTSGNIWAANDMGLLEFDGREWTLTPVHNRTSVRSVFFDASDDKMYFGAVNEVGYIDLRGNLDTGYTSILDSLTNTLNDIWGIHKIGNTFYFRENNRVFSYCDGKCKEYDFPNKVSVSEAIDKSLFIFVNSIGVMQQNANGEFEHLKGTETLNNMDICSIKKKGDALEFISATNGIFLLKDNVLSKIDNSLSASLKNSIVYCCATSENYRAYGTVNDGVFIWKEDENEILHLNTSTGLQNNTVLSMYFDEQGNLWLGLDKGISLVKLNSAEYRFFAANDMIGAGYAAEIYDNKLWLGTNQGLYYCPYYGTVKQIKDTDVKSYSWMKGQIWDLFEYDGKLFVCADKGLGIIQGESFEFLPMNGTWKIINLVQHPNYLLGCSYDRLFLLKNTEGKWKFYKWISGFDENSKVFMEDSDGSIWFSHWLKGLYNLHIDFENGYVIKEQYLSRGNGFPQDWGNVPIKLHDRIIFQTASGFYELDKTLESAKPIKELNDLFSNEPSGMNIYELSDNDLFFSSASIQAFRSGQTTDSLSLKSLVSKRIQGFENLKEFEDGTFMLNTEDGFSVINKSSLKTKASVSDEHLYIKEIAIPRHQGDSVIYRAWNNKAISHEITIPFKDNSLKFKVAFPTFNTEDKVLFSYRLNGYDKEWSSFQENPIKEYIRISPGEYTFQVRAKVPDKMETTSTEIPIEVLKPWYRKNAAVVCFIIIALGIMAISGALIKKLIERSLLKSQREKENLEKEKRMNKELQMKADELASSTMDLIRKNEILQKIDTELQKAADSMSDDRNKTLMLISRIRTDIKDNISHDNSWKKFEKNFDLVYVDFLKKLEKTHPGLSTTDKKLCAYLKMGLSSKEIAPLLNITTRSVEMNRYRLRKKLGLDREDNLINYLNRF